MRIYLLIERNSYSEIVNIAAYKEKEKADQEAEDLNSERRRIYIEDYMFNNDVSRQTAIKELSNNYYDEFAVKEIDVID